MSKLLRVLKSKGKFLVAIALATLVGGAAAGAVMAAIPNASGVIHGCYRNSGNVLNPKGSVRIIDYEVGEVCNASNETAITWNQTGPQGPSGSPGSPGTGKTLKVVIQGQKYGPVIHDFDAGSARGVTFFYEPLQRIVAITGRSYADPGIERVIVGEPMQLHYASSDCTGAPYAFYTSGLSGGFMFNYLLNGSRSEYYIVERSQQPISVTSGSFKEYDYKTETSSCIQRDEAMQLVPITPVALPIADTLDPSSAPFEFIYE